MEIAKRENGKETYSLVHVTIELVHRIIKRHQIGQCNNLLQHQIRIGNKLNRIKMKNDFRKIEKKNLVAILNSLHHGIATVFAAANERHHLHRRRRRLHH